jgi:hypothetical protein
MTFEFCWGGPQAALQEHCVRAFISLAYGAVSLNRKQLRHRTRRFDPIQPLFRRQRVLSQLRNGDEKAAGSSCCAHAASR